MQGCHGAIATRRNGSRVRYRADFLAISNIEFNSASYLKQSVDTCYFQSCKIYKTLVLTIAHFRPMAHAAFTDSLYSTLTQLSWPATDLIIRKHNVFLPDAKVYEAVPTHRRTKIQTFNETGKWTVMTVNVFVAISSYRLNMLMKTFKIRQSDWDGGGVGGSIDRIVGRANLPMCFDVRSIQCWQLFLAKTLSQIAPANKFGVTTFHQRSRFCTMSEVSSLL